jgi:Putative Actinobacterial Holin-X, holin superfamily III
MNPAVYTREPTLAQLLARLMHDTMVLLRQEVALAKHELRAELWNLIRAVLSLSLGEGIAAIGGWLLILMLVHLLHALTVLPLWACYGMVGGLFAMVGGALLGLGKQKLPRMQLEPQDSMETMQENVQSITEQVRRNGRSTRDSHP